MLTFLLLIALLAAGNTEASKACERKLDLCVLLDGSTNICNGNPACLEWNSILQFSKDFVSSFKIGPQDTKVALVTMGNGFHKEWDLDGYKNESSVLSAIEKVKNPGGEFENTDIVSTAMLETEIFNVLYGERPSLVGDDYTNILMVITNGVPDLNGLVADGFSKLYHETKTAEIVVCVKPGCTEQWVRGIASDPPKANVTYFMVDNYFSLTSVLEILVEQICEYKMPLIPVLPSDIVPIKLI
jgi:hypothetical protein